MLTITKQSLLNILGLLLVSTSFVYAQDSGLQGFDSFGKDAEKTDARGQLNSPAPDSEVLQPTSVYNNPSVSFTSSNSEVTPPTERARINVNPEAPAPFVGMADAYFKGDLDVAKLYAKQFVRYLSDLMFAVKDMTSLIGNAMIEEGSIDEESWVGVEQYLDYQMAQARIETASAVKPSHEDALRRIKADPNGEVEIYYFFTLNCRYCRQMAPDVERLWRLSKTDPKIKMVGLTLGTTAAEWISSYKSYTGLTLPIFNGEQVAKLFKVAFVPAVVVLAPNSKTAYLKTGKIDFARLYEVVKKTQGQSTELSPQGIKLLKAKIGKQEQLSESSSRGSGVISQNYNHNINAISAVDMEQTPTITRF